MSPLRFNVLIITTLAVASLALGVLSPHWRDELRAQLTEVDVSVSATTDHVADGIDTSVVMVTVTDGLGNPVIDADVVLDISPPAFVNQLAHFVLHLPTTNTGDGNYVASFASPVAGPISLVATDRHSLVSGITFTEFLSLPSPPLVAALEPAQDPVDNCKNYFDKLDDEFLPSILRRRIEAETDATQKAALQQRLDDLVRRLPDGSRVGIIPVIERDIAIETKIARGETPTQDEKDALERAKLDTKPSFERNSIKQEEILSNSSVIRSISPNTSNVPNCLIISN